MSLLSGIKMLRRGPTLSRYLFLAQSTQVLSTKAKKEQINNFKELANTMVKTLNDADLETHKLLLQNLRLEFTSEETIIRQLQQQEEEDEANWYSKWLLQFLTKKEENPFPILIDESFTTVKRQRLAFELSAGIFAVKSGESNLVEKLMNPPNKDWRHLTLTKEDFLTLKDRRAFNISRSIANTFVERLDHAKLKQLSKYLRKCYLDEMNTFELIQKSITLFSLHLDEIEPFLVHIMSKQKMHDIQMLVSARRVCREQLLSDLRYELFHLLRRRDFVHPKLEKGKDNTDSKQSNDKKNAKNKKNKNSTNNEVQSPAENAMKANSALIADMQKFTENRELFYKQRLTFGSAVIFQLKLDCYRRALQVKPEQKHSIQAAEETPTRSMKGGRELQLQMRMEELERIETEAYIEDFATDPVPSLASLYHGKRSSSRSSNDSIDAYDDTNPSMTDNNHHNIMEDQFDILKQKLNLSPDRKFLLTNLPANVTEETIRGMLVNCGKVQSIQIFRHFVSGDDDHDEHGGDSHLGKVKRKNKAEEGAVDGEEEETLSLSSLPSSSQLHASDAQEVAESLVAFDKEVYDLLKRREARRLGHEKKGVKKGDKKGDIDVSEDFDDSEDTIEAVGAHDDHVEAVVEEPEEAKTEAEEVKPAPKRTRIVGHKLSYKTIARARRTDTYAMVVMEDDMSYNNATALVIKLFGFNLHGQSCLPVPATQLSHFYIECRYGMKVSDVLFALDVFLEGQFDCYLSRSVVEKLKPVYLKLAFPTHSDAALAYHILSQNEALVETSEYSRSVDRTKLWGVTWMRPARYWDLAKRAKHSVENMDMFTSRMMDHLLEQDIDAAIAEAAIGKNKTRIR